MTIYRLSPVKAACFACLLTLIVTFSTISQTAANNDYENQQRTAKLLQFDKEVNSIPEAEIRLQLRFSILDFIYTNEVRSQYASAEPILTAYFEDIKSLEKLLLPGSVSNKNRITLLLRKHYPEMAKVIEAKYLIQVDTSSDDYEAIGKKGSDLNGIIDRTRYKLNMTNSLEGGFSNIFDRIRRTSPQLGDRLLNSALEMSEMNPTPNNAVWLERLMIDVSNPPPPEVSPRQMLRYFKILIASAQGGKNYARVIWPMRRALPNIQKADPKLYAQGLAIVASYRRGITKEQLFKEEADDKIEWAPDKLTQAISEAEAATTVEMRDYFWNRASQIATPARKGDWKPAVDLLMKATPRVGTSDPKTRDRLLANRAYWAQSWQEFESAKYAIDRIEDDDIGANATLRYASEFARWNYKDRQKGAVMIDEAIGQLGKTTPDYFTVCEIGNARIYLTVFTQFTTINDLTARTVRIINRYPSNGAEANAGSDERAEFLKVIKPVIPCAAYVFKPIGGSSFEPIRSAAPDPALANDINVRELRLAAQIEAEKYRKYPLPK